MDVLQQKLTCPLDLSGHVDSFHFSVRDTPILGVTYTLCRDVSHEICNACIAEHFLCIAEENKL
jgi:hypothetical protein